MKLLSPAKINLFLRVLRRREDGYHDLASLFQAVDLADILEFHFAEQDQLTCSESHLLCDSSNLVWKAVALFRNKTGLKTPLKIHLEKRIPLQAGIGGGSSNAATTLYALNQLHKTNLDDEQLSNWAAEIGSDISFFFSKGRAFCTGRGEIIENLSHVQTPHLWLVKPPSGLSTPLIFKTLKLSTCSSLSPQVLLKKNRQGIFFLNDLEAPAFEVMPELAHLKKELEKQGFVVSLTGSGTGLLCLGEKRPLLDSSILCFPLKYIYREENNWFS